MRAGRRWGVCEAMSGLSDLAVYWGVESEVVKAWRPRGVRKPLRSAEEARARLEALRAKQDLQRKLEARERRRPGSVSDAEWDEVFPPFQAGWGGGARAREPRGPRGRGVGK